MDLKVIKTDTSDMPVHQLFTECRVNENGPSNQSESSAGIPCPVWVSGSEQRTVLWKHVDRDFALQIRAGDTPDWELVIRLWRRYDEPSELEKARILKFLHERELSKDELIESVLPLLGISRSAVWANTYVRIPSLPDTMKRLIHTGDVSIRLVRYLLEVPDTLQAPLFRGVSRGKFDFSVQEARRLSECLRRLETGEYDNFKDELEQTPETGDQRERGRQIIHWIEKRAFPDLHVRRRKFHHDLDQLELNHGIEVKPPSNFEGDYLDFKFRCHRSEKLTDILEELKKCQKLFRHV